MSYAVGRDADFEETHDRLIEMARDATRIGVQTERKQER